MLTSLQVTGFRNLSSLTMEGLTRVNLLVGENNAGKTSVLEALEILLVAPSQPLVLTRGPLRRGEIVVRPQSDKRRYDGVVDLRHLFCGREFSPGSQFLLQGQTAHEPLSVDCEIRSFRQRQALHLVLTRDEVERATPDILVTTHSGIHRTTSALPLELIPDYFNLDYRPESVENPPETEKPTQFVEAVTPETKSLVELWERIVLNPEEARVIEALQIIEPGVERLASLSTSFDIPSGIVVKIQHSDHRIPLGSLGEGIRRLLVLAMNLVTSASGYMLVDEIDTGLHYSVMVKMWKLVVETARRLNIQVFATSHSLDCIQALAALYEREPDVRDDISLHRLEKGARASIRYSADEILNAAQRQVEVR